MEKQIKALKELNEAAASMQVEFKKKLDTMKADGYCDKPMGPCIDDVMCYCYNMFSSINDRISRLSTDMYDYQYNHSKGHSLPLKTAVNVEKYLKACGMEDDYNVEKPTIYIQASDKSPNTKVLFAEYKKTP